VFASHHWPRFGRDDARAFLVLQRDLYRWLHDQTMRRANHGLTPLEIAEDLALPECFSAQGHTRQYYGTVSHNAKAVYQRYLGWFDGNPANLDPHPPAEAGRRYVEFMGGAGELLRRARASFDAGDYRWVAQVVNHLVFADPTNREARTLQADALEQLGYQAESGPWRNFYLTGAMELRDGVPDGPRGRGRAMTDALTVEQIFDALGVRLIAEAVEGRQVVLNWRLIDSRPAGDHIAGEAVEEHVLGLANCALHHTPGRLDPGADATLTLTRRLLGELLTGRTTAADAIEAGTLTVEGDVEAPLIVFGALDTFDDAFAIVEP
ncbi:MAG: alkyl sulfatase dimerization domain-containing protein, partial [Acidimicrobiales bacterium]